MSEPIDHVAPFSVADLAELHVDSWTAPFWRATCEERLVGCACGRCGTFRMPGPICPVCGSADVIWRPLSGQGTVFSYTVVRHAVIPQVRGQLPYVIAVIDLAGAPGLRLIANLWNVAVDDLRIGMPVEVHWDHISTDVCIPRFVPLDPEE
ncbi:Zn-ribbon domain-containing OB-fold protein [Streptomyces cadmiisoli]|uniref:Zn-ribbon domain-containing OB-fold protein n=1 Tax=Streptomyces cadmiisoli TaxID=2184053 RepID=UPI003D759E91